MATLALTNLQVVGNELALAWTDGEENYFPLDFLRRSCPCALCEGEPDVLGRILKPNVNHTPGSFTLKSHHIVGGYGWQPTWADGHQSGIYSFSYLRRLGEAIE